MSEEKRQLEEFYVLLSVYSTLHKGSGPLEAIHFQTKKDKINTQTKYANTAK